MIAGMQARGFDKSPVTSENVKVTATWRMKDTIHMGRDG